MPLYANDVSEYVAPRETRVVRLVAEIGRSVSERSRSRYLVEARVDDGPPFTGQFTPSPDWGQGSDTPVQSMSNVYSGGLTGSSLGTQLFTALFSGGLSRCWAKAVEKSQSRGGLHVVIRSADLSVHALPWELLSDPMASTGPVALADGCSVIREYPRLSSDPVPVSEPVDIADLHVLVMTAAIGGLNEDNDPKILFESFPGADVEAVPHVGHESLARALSERGRHIVHLLASGVRGRQGQQSLMLGQTDIPETLTVSEFIDTLAAQHHKDLRLVVLAACDSDLFAAELARTVPNVIGMRGRISDDGCLAFLRGFYRALGSGSSIDQAAASGRAQQIGFSQSLGEDWALPVLFLASPTPIVRRAASATHELAPELVQPSPSDTLEEQTAQFLLEMKRSNLRSLRDQWDQVDKGSTPRFIQDQIDALDHDVQEIADKGQGPT